MSVKKTKTQCAREMEKYLRKRNVSMGVNCKQKVPPKEGC